MKEGTGCKKGWKQKGDGLLRGSFTIEAALLVPLVLAILLLLLQLILYLHDNVAAEAWLYQETWKQRWNQEQGQLVFEEETAPVMAVLRGAWTEEMRKGNMLQREVGFDTHLLPSFVTVLWQEMPTQTEKRSAEHSIRSEQFMRVVGAILEEWKETVQ